MKHVSNVSEMFVVGVEMQGTACYRILESGSKRIAKIPKTELRSGLNILLRQPETREARCNSSASDMRLDWAR
jgi:hypothetical protein